MKELYWIERLNYINGAFIFLLVFFSIFLLFSYIAPWVEDWDDEDMEEKRIRSKRKVSIWVISISFLVFVFVPSTKEMYRIIGIGGTIDYLRQNETAKQLPDKCIKAVDMFLDKVTEKEKTKDDKPNGNRPD